MEIVKFNLLLIFFISLAITTYGQGKIDYMEFPRHAVSVAPSNIFFDGNGNTMFYKYRISQSEDKLRYLRAG